MADDYLAQVHFTGESSCTKFVSNPFRGNICTSCSKEIFKHNKSSVKSKEVLMKMNISKTDVYRGFFSVNNPLSSNQEQTQDEALEYTQSVDKKGSVIIPSHEVNKVGGLYLGGYKPSINKQFLQNQHITHILNAAGGLVNFFGTKYETKLQVKFSSNIFVEVTIVCLDSGLNIKTIVRKLNIEYLTFFWDDDSDFEIRIDDVLKGLAFIHNGRTNGNVLVHCAQGKSRSSTIVVAYTMAFMNLSWDKALEYVKERRKMAEPNPGFLKLLSGLNSNEKFLSFSKELNTN